MRKILFFNPPSKRNAYLSTNTSVGAPRYPNLTLATLAGNLIKVHKMKIIDLDLLDNFYEPLFDEIQNFRPDIIASCINTLDYIIIKGMMYRIKEKYPYIKTVVGGVHITALPDEISKTLADWLNALYVIFKYKIINWCVN